MLRILKSQVMLLRRPQLPRTVCWSEAVASCPRNRNLSPRWTKVHGQSSSAKFKRYPLTMTRGKVLQFKTPGEYRSEHVKYFCFQADTDWVTSHYIRISRHDFAVSCSETLFCVVDELKADVSMTQKLSYSIQRSLRKFWYDSTHDSQWLYNTWFKSTHN